MPQFSIARFQEPLNLSGSPCFHLISTYSSYRLNLLPLGKLSIHSTACSYGVKVLIRDRASPSHRLSSLRTASQLGIASPSPIPRHRSPPGLGVRVLLKAANLFAVEQKINLAQSSVEFGLGRMHYFRSSGSHFILTSRRNILLPIRPRTLSDFYCIPSISSEAECESD
jgi:hypothetical protein